MNSKNQESKEDKYHITEDLRGETMAFAVQSAVYNLGANFFEPYINYKVQRYYSHNDVAHSGNYTQNLAGEFVGDVFGSSALFLAEVICPEQLHATTRTLRGWIDPFYSRFAYQACAEDRHEPDYEQKVEQWKVFQERNLVRSSLVATAGLIGNIATQKLVIGNPSPTKVIFAGKLLSTAVTTTLGLAARFAFPEQMNGVDRWISDKTFKRWLTDKSIKPNIHDSHVARLSEQAKESSYAQER